MRRVHRARLSAWVGTSAVLVAVTAACGSTEAGAEGSGSGSPTASASRPSPSHARFVEEIEWADGRRVGMYYAAGRGLMEQHQDTAGGPWSKPRLVYATEGDSCQGITLKAIRGTVAVMANWGVYCSDGEPPTESLAAVGTRNLSTWDTKATKDFDGWEKARAVTGTEDLLFSRSSTEWLTRLRWSPAGGFGEVENIRR
ncbi:hypothetical protein O1Q96_19235 [Streptomyces sp. Qhu-G9]|uniref:hypothetical protein n=1 Tax=Streptomyces sp. Qhu-G9 TaxID=3452799 RepID=UPI0022AC711B|nr:hypothetical protein [Streptomyces aurantiacus]WAU81727.1 hypothetical protein O1Q96_19235 [Streptomyces aurantiacus]